MIETAALIALCCLCPALASGTPRPPGPGHPGRTGDGPHPRPGTGTTTPGHGDEEIILLNKFPIDRFSQAYMPNIGRETPGDKLC